MTLLWFGSCFFSSQVVLYFVLMLVTCEKSSSTCKFEFVSASSNFGIYLENLTRNLFNDYEVPVVSNLEPDKHCLVLWQIYDTYTMLKNLTEKAQIDLKERITNLLRELQFLEACTFSVSETCTKHKQALVQVLEKFDFEQLENIIGDYSNCTVLRCVSGNTIALTDHPDDYLDNITTNYSTEGQDAGTKLNSEDYLQLKRNKSALNQETSQTKRNRRFSIALVVPFLLCSTLLLWIAWRKPT
ncbi:fms-related tyrosine kinase 3 ligand isoform X3 [Aquarana catesbeiana]|uniref:fms-related tyrosine kinase 3 ligand isoform X3 n=1 Tax=Aquarana catesbeiana TaxID=8400 RepID=UPI003CC9F148